MVEDIGGVGDDVKDAATAMPGRISIARTGRGDQPHTVPVGRALQAARLEGRAKCAVMKYQSRAFCRTADDNVQPATVGKLDLLLHALTPPSKM